MARGRPSYDRRMMHRATRMQHDVEPTMAEYTAHVYQVTLTHGSTRLDMPIIALDEAHAIDVARQRHGAGPETAASAVHPDWRDEPHFIQTLMISEGEDEREARRALYDARRAVSA